MSAVLVLNNYFIKNFLSGLTRANSNIFPTFGEEQNLAKISQVPNFGSACIRPTCFNQNFTDRNMRHRIYISQLSILFFHTLLDSLVGFVDNSKVTIKRSKRSKMDCVKNDFVALSYAPNLPNRPKLFSRRNFFQTCFKKHDT